jgi:hypothetical protein
MVNIIIKKPEMNVERVCDMVRTYAHGEHGKYLKREHNGAMETHREASKEGRANNGWTNKKTFRRVAQVPKAAIDAYRKEVGHTHDKKHMMQWLKNNGFHTVARNSF